ncbi:MAG: quinohemoprotein amine dehydrogenase subunit alpha [Gemmatimonadota bacterium]|nr:quinohemoprotein amine dehydrogenase subunit alpha [Gemmatimonadota bacterium]MDH5758713.1 quinohemoprotein amine dehydrogenase subunit alpha [Gemmatimonadota bacterium]
MASPVRAVLLLAGIAGLGVLLAWSPVPQAEDEGYPVHDQTVVDRCSGCHRVDDEGRMTRVSYLRKTPEGWQTSVRRMVALYNVKVSPEEARDIVRYLSDAQGLAPEELRPGRFEVERRMVEYDYEGDSGVEFTCMSCHSMGRVVTQRRTREEWELLLATHRALYPLVDFQAFRRPGPPATEPGPDGSPPDPRHPMDRAVDHLSAAFPLETPEWSAWSATKRAPRLAGSWALSGYEAGKGAVYGTVEVSANSGDPGAFTTTTAYVYAESGERVTRTGQAVVYTGYQWRGRSNPGGQGELREVMLVERDQDRMTGRWFTGAYDEIGLDVSLERVGGGAFVTGVHPRAVERGATVEVRMFGGGFAAAAAGDLDFGEGVTVTGVRGEGGALRVGLRVDAAAAVGERDLVAFGKVVEGALAVHDGVDRISVTPPSGMARLGGGNFPKGFQTFDAVAFDDGPDGRSDTEDDVELGRVPVTWSVEEYAAVFGDEDVRFVGAMGEDGTFVPAEDGPNPQRAGNRNNVGDVWVVATHRTSDGAELRARAHLLVTVPLYMRFEPWREVSR